MLIFCVECTDYNVCFNSENVNVRPGTNVERKSDPCSSYAKSVSLAVSLGMIERLREQAWCFRSRLYAPTLPATLVLSELTDLSNCSPYHKVLNLS